MPLPSPKGPNPLAHLANRQIGNNVDNFRKNLFKERLNIAKNLYRKDLVSHFGCVNAIEFSNEGELLISGGDDRRVLLWHLETAIADCSEPRAMEKQHQSNIFCLGFNNDNSKILSGGNDDTVIVHDLKTGEPFDVFLHAKPVYGLSVDRNNDHIFSTAGEDGRVLIFDMRQGTEVLSLAKYRAPFHAVQFHPLDGNFVITANGKEGAAFWDLRHTKTPSIRYGGDDAAQSCMSVRFNTLGNHVLALRRRLPPILYNTCSQIPICQFYHPDYYNSCTMKSCCFAGDDDDYILSGSDDFNLYAWKISDADCNKTNQFIDTHHMILYGHRSIVNQVRFNSQKCMIASSGVEKIVKLWHPFEIEGWKGGLNEMTTNCETQREVFSHDEYFSLMNSAGPSMTHDYSNQNTTEDSRMMAFFDSLVQREIEGWNSNDNMDSDISSQHSSDGSSRPTSTESSDSIARATNYVRRRLTMKPRTIYANRIAYLIATKRNTLKRLALMGAANTERRIKSANKIGGRKLQRGSVRITRKGNGKRAGRLNNNARSRSRDDNSDTEVPKKVTKRRIQQHLNTTSYRSFRRKSKTTANVSTANNNRYHESPDTSSDEDSCHSLTNNTKDTSANQSILPSTSKSIASTSSTSAAAAKQQDINKYLNIAGRCNTPSTDDDDEDNNEDDDDDDDDDNDTAITLNPVSISPIFPMNLAVPSTSTGITASGMLFRAPPLPIDSDEDQSLQNTPPQSPINLVRVVPLPLNGTHKLDESYSSGIDEDNSNTINNQSSINEIRSSPSNLNNNNNNNYRRRKRVGGAAPLNTTNDRDNFSSSQTNSCLSSSSPDQYASSSDSLTSFYSKNKKRKTAHKSSSNNNDGNSSSMIDTNSLEAIATTTDVAVASTSASSSSLSKTPSNSFRSSKDLQSFTPDSGIASSTCGSTGGENGISRNNNNNTNNDTTPYDNNNGLINGNGYRISLNNNGNRAIATGSSSIVGDTSSSALSLKIFQQKVARVRRNYSRKNFGDDESDSD